VALTPSLLIFQPKAPSQPSYSRRNNWNRPYLSSKTKKDNLSRVNWKATLRLT
jgi:hypothetical protein